MSRPGLGEQLRCDCPSEARFRRDRRRSVGAHADLDSGVDRWPVVGRSNELRQLAAAVVARRGAVITGPAGVGKTTLAVTGVELGGLFKVELLARTIAQECGSFERALPARGEKVRHARCLRRILFRRQSLLARSQATLHFPVDAAGMIG